MKLEQFKEKKKSKKVIIILIAIILLIGGIIIGSSFASFKESKSFKVMEGNFIYEGSGDITLAFYHGNESLTKMPVKNNTEGFLFDKGECNKGATIEWDDKDWSPKIKNLQETKTVCSLYFKKNSDVACNSAGLDSGACYIAQMADSDKTNMKYDNTIDNNARFISQSANNYVSFNNGELIWRGYSSSSSSSNYKEYNTLEECKNGYEYHYNCEQVPAWRIIGVMNNIEDESGNIKSHLKIIRGSTGNYSWDGSSESINNGYGVNEWSTSAVEKVLNDNYYNKKTGGTCYRGTNLQTIECPKWVNIGLDEEARKMISKIKWHTGTIPKQYGLRPTNDATYMYEMERSENDGKYCSVSAYCNDKVTRTTSWTGYVGLMYPSDFAFSGVSSCFGEFNGYNCDGKYWLNYGNPDHWQWTMTPIPDNINEKNAFEVYFIDNKNVLNGDGYAANYMAYVRPVVYLNSNIKIKPSDASDYGSITNPYVLEI